MCNSFKDTRRQPALADTHARPVYKPAGGNRYISSCFLLLIAKIPQKCKALQMKGFPIRPYYNFYTLR